MFEKTKYRYSPITLRYEEAEISFRRRLLRFLSYLVTGLVFASTVMFLAYNFIDSPKEKRLKRENEQLKLQYNVLNKKIEQFAVVLEDVQNTDDNIYRVIFEAEPIPENIRKSGFGGVTRYKHLDGYENSDLVIETTKRLDKIAKQLYIQSKSFDDVFQMAKQKEKMLASIPAIQPISNKDLTRIASGFGYRIDPVYKTTQFHFGIDFSAHTGTDIYATGNGKIVLIEQSAKGYGNHVIVDHGFGYKTLYGHMSVIIAKLGQTVNRGDIIGKVGSTGKSTGPHLHYEVFKNDVKIDPVNFFFNDLTEEEYEKMIEISKNFNQPLD